MKRSHGTPHAGLAWATAALLLVAHLASAGLARAQGAGASLIARAERAYEARRYQDVIRLLRPALYPRSTLASQSEEVQAYTLLGKAYWWRRQLTAKGAERKRLERLAAQQFAALLSLRPSARLSRLIHPKPLVDFFEAVRKRLRAHASPLKALETELRHCKRRLRETRVAFAAYKRAHRTRVLVEKTVVKRQYFWNFVPFGVGQFQNGHVVKGSLFAAGQGALLLTNLAMLLLAESPYVRTRWGGTLQDNLLARQRAREIQVTAVVVGSLFWGLAIWGIADALYDYRPTQVIQKQRLVPVRTSRVSLSPRLGGGQYALDLTVRF
jgi:hypothetical protein